MQRQEFVIQNKVGLHARPAAALVQTANKFDSNITIGKDGKTASAKSILEVLTLGAEEGSVISIEIEGSDEQQAMKAVEALVNNKFGNEE